jgi:glycosyltransferase involved in cell wall biosynthesis
VKFAFRILFRNPAVRIIVQNSADQKLVESFGVPSKRIALIAGSGVDLSVFKLKPEPTGPVVVAMVSRMLWDKGVGELVEAARLVRSEIHDVVIRLVGPMDPANPSCIPESTLKDWVREGVVEWTGGTREVPSVWADAHICVLPSYREGLPKSLLEAAACGRPLIATDVPGCRDVVVHEETGLLVPPRDPNSLARAIIRLARDPRLRTHLGNAARGRVEQHFSVGKVVEQTLAFYRSILTTA